MLMQMGTTVAVAGASGYAGGELLRLIDAHPDLTLGALCAHGQAGQNVAEVHPQLRSLADRKLQPTDVGVLSRADVVLLALPHGASATLAGELPSDVVVIDLGADFRLHDPAEWARFYPGSAHAGTWVYGLPELPGQRERLLGSTRVALPGCYPTATALALAPLLAQGLVECADLVVVAASGTSGAGRAASARLLGTEVMGDVSAYKVATHQHTPEIRQALTSVAGAPVSISFTPMLVPMSRGMLASCTARITPGVTEAQLREALAYADEPFVHLLPAGLWPHSAATVGSNSCHLQVAIDEDAGRAVVVSAIDNLGKGAAHQAVQVLNLLQGRPETTGLSVNGVAP
jgi:N-acetyl-gamma-glutamyl-phosphate reductase